MRIHDLLLILLFASAAVAEESTGLQVPNGFVVTRYATDDLAHDIYSMTINARGQVVVAGPGYVRTLIDEDNNGVADSFLQFSSLPRKGAHGLVFDGPDLICAGDNSVMKIRDTDGDGVADQAPEIWARLRNPEHGANGLIQGPDGWFYLICGNDAGVNASHAQTPSSPVHDPRSGTLLRFSPDGQTTEIVAEGFRNPYDLSINRYGHIFTVDSDGERDHHLPWYAPTRLFDIAEGEHHGWVNNGWKLSWSRPVSFCDNVDRVAELGRGSPTGLVVYSHGQFPTRYHNGVFSCCWTLGRVYFIPLEISGATYQGSPEVFLQTIGDVGFAPVDMAVGPSGDLFVAIGGRGTQGSVFRVGYASPAPRQEAASKIESILNADQPLSAWSRAVWKTRRETLGAQPFQFAAVNDQLPIEQRIRAIEILVEVFDGLPSNVVRKLSQSAVPVEVSARAAWAIGRKMNDNASALITLSESQNPRIVRAALNPLASQSPSAPDLSAPQVDTRLCETDRRIRNAWIRWLAANVRIPRLRDKQAAARVLQRRNESTTFAPSALLGHADIADPRLLRLELLRLLQLQLGDIHVTESTAWGMVGYSRNNKAALDELEREACEQFLLGCFPANDKQIDWEIARVAAMLKAENTEWPQILLDRCSEESEVESDIHYLMALAHVTGARSKAVSEKTAATLLHLHRKMSDGEKFPSRNWPVRIAETYRRLCMQDARLAQTLISHAAFGAAEHSLYVLNTDKPFRLTAAQSLAHRVDHFDDDDWNTALVQVIGLLPNEQAFRILRGQWAAYDLQSAIVEVLARSPSDLDRSRFLDALRSARPATVECAATALTALPPNASTGDISFTMRSLRRHCSAQRYASTRKALTRLLRHWTGQQYPIDDQGLQDQQVVTAYQPYFDWFTSQYPKQSATLHGFSGQAEWKTRLDNLDWNAGETSRGRRVYERLQCAGCHSGNRRLGPELHPVAKRFSRDDLFAAIIDPNQNVSPLYQTKRFETRSGRAYTGMVVYESPNGTLLQLGPDEVVRIADDEILTITDSPNSLMPTGLLREATDRDLIDLYAYLQQLARP